MRKGKESVKRKEKMEPLPLEKKENMKKKMGKKKEEEEE